MFAVRLWWLLRWMEKRGGALDGGLAKWTAKARDCVGQEMLCALPLPDGRGDLVVDVDEVARLPPRTGATDRRASAGR